MKTLLTIVTMFFPLIFGLMLTAVAVWSLEGCAFPGGVVYASDNFQCPQSLLYSVEKKLEELKCPTQPAPPNPSQ